MKLADIKTSMPFSLLLSDPELCKEVQQSLVSDGFSCIVDGIYGDKTQNALVQFKRKYSLIGGNQLGKTTAMYLISAHTLAKKALAPTVKLTGGVTEETDNGFIKASEYTTLCESIKTEAYPDSGGVWTIGIGAIKFEDGTPVKEGDTITKDEALILFDKQFKTYWDRCANAIPEWNSMHSGQRAALASLAYNAGYRYRNGRFDSLDAQIDTNQPLTALLKYNKVFSDEYPDGNPELGLSRRRYGEFLMSVNWELSAKQARTVAWSKNSIAEIEQAVLS